MPKFPLVSVIIPTYQHGSVLPSTLAALFRQTLADFEVIVVDDGSTDGTAERLAPWLDRIRIIRQENSGAPVARNRGAAEARGEFVIFLDADARLRPDALELLVDALRRDQHATYAYASFALGWKKFRFWPFDGETLKGRNYIHTSALIRRARFPGFDEKLLRLQDWDLWLTMLERGDRGVFVDETLLFIAAQKHAGGMSRWVPSCLALLHRGCGGQARPPFGKLGLRNRNLESYAAAERIVREKHGLAPESAYPKPPVGPVRVFTTALLLLVLLELVSLTGFLLPDANVAAFAIIVAALTVVAYARPDVALLAVLAELIVGSQGGNLLSLPVGGLNISLRLALFMAVFTAWAARAAVGLVRGGEDRRAAMDWWRLLKERRLAVGYIAVLAAVAMGTVVGVLRGNGFGNVFFDANGYFFLALLPVVVAAWRRDTWPRLLAVGCAALTVSLAKALFVFYVYSHRVVGLARTMYVWVRDLRVGEITRMGEGGDFYRIFFQSHVYFLAAGLIAIVVILYARRPGTRPVALAAFASSALVLVLGLSRSFWVGCAAAGFALFGCLIWGRASWRVWRRFLWPVLPLAVAGVAVIAAVYAFPWPDRATGGASWMSVIGGRAVGLDDAAARSRWALLPALTEAGLKHPVIGSGFGTTVTYETSDPRQTASPAHGRYTTYAFEWGWHDMWLKFGFLGVGAFLYFLWAVAAPLVSVVRRSRQRFRDPEPGLAPEQKKAVLAFGTLLAVAAVAATSVFSPYLNHPLGLGFVIFAAGLGTHLLED
jgi:hypothetical protein